MECQYKKNIDGWGPGPVTAEKYIENRRNLNKCVSLHILHTCTRVHVQYGSLVEIICVILPHQNCVNMLESTDNVQG